MNVAQYKLCQELYEASGWDGTFLKYDKYSVRQNNKPSIPYVQVAGRANFIVSVELPPAYDLGYLLERLMETPKVILSQMAGRRWWARIKRGQIADGKLQTVSYDETGGTPEDAVCRLAIKLFRMNVLEKEKL